MVGSNSNNLCNVLASNPVDSESLFAALPVGAHNKTLALVLMIWIILFTTVVLPTPGPPVIQTTLLVIDFLTASV